MNRARIALFLHFDLLTWETGRWSLTYSGTCSRAAGRGSSPCRRRRLGLRTASDRISGSAITLCSGPRDPGQRIGEQHVREDLGFIPSVADWVRAISRNRTCPRAGARRLPLK
jgi:hypothetical protein